MKISATYKIILIGLVLLSSLISGCSTGALSLTVDVSLYAEEAWKADAEIVYSQLQIETMGEELSLLIEESVAMWRNAGLQASYVKRTTQAGNLEYDLTISGEGYALLNQAFFDGLATIELVPQENPSQVNFSFFPMGSWFSLALSRKFTLHAGSILSSNGTVIDERTVTWYNPVDTMQATVTPIQAAPSAAWLLLGGAALLIFVLVLALKGRYVKCPVCGVRQSRKSTFCSNCGGIL